MIFESKNVCRACLSLLTGFLFVGCAQLSPQQIDFKPSISTKNLIKGSGRPGLTVSDNRNDKIIGYRGGVYQDTSTIVALRPLEKVIEALAIKVLEQTGIEVSTSFPDMSIKINLDKLTYVTEDVKASIKRTTAEAAVSIEIKKNNTTLCCYTNTCSVGDCILFSVYSPIVFCRSFMTCINFIIHTRRKSIITE